MDWQTAGTVASVVIALCALGYTIWQGKQLQKHNKLSFRPHITSWSHRNGEQGIYAVEVMNNGLGPAIIDSFTIMVDGKVIAGEGTEPIVKAMKIMFPVSEYQSHHSYLGKNYAMAAKEKCTILAVQFKMPASLTKEVVEHTFKRADLVIKYRSFYEEEFTYSSLAEKSNT